MKMKKEFWVCILILAIVTLGYYYWATLTQRSYHMVNLIYDHIKVHFIKEEPTKTNWSPFTASTLLKEGKGILFVETTNRMKPPSLVLCSIESAARVYPDRPVFYFMNGLQEILTDEKKIKELFKPLSDFKNIHFFPLRMAKLFNGTPFMDWYKKVIPEKEVYWTHVSSDACRFAMMWKYGGIYMDTDVISIRRIPNDNFIAAETHDKTSSSVFGLSPSHYLTRHFMKNFVDNYRGDVWAYQGPGVFTRVVREVCGMPKFTSAEDVMVCNGTPYLHPDRFYPIPYPQWRRYFEVWKEIPEFKDSYALHLWNFMNKEGKTMHPKSNTLVEDLFQQHCPTTYNFTKENEKPENHR